MEAIVSGTVVFSILAAMVWMKSALLAKGKSGDNFIDRRMNKISTDHTTWNAIVAGLAAAAAFSQWLQYVLQYGF